MNLNCNLCRTSIPKKRRGNHKQTNNAINVNAIFTYKIRFNHKFCEAMAKQNSNAFRFLSKKFLKLSQAKLKGEIFLGRQIEKMFEIPNFKESCNA